MKDYYSCFVELSLRQCTKNDYADKKKVRVHNEMSKKLLELQTEMSRSDCTEVLHKLLSHEDDRVRCNAASMCLQIGVLPEKAVLVLKKIADSSTDPTVQFSAKMLLQNINC